MAENKEIVAAAPPPAPLLVIPNLSKITEHKLNHTNFLEWRKTIKLFLRSIGKVNHWNEDPPTDENEQIWVREDAQLFLQIQNSIDSEILGLVNHCETVKELVDYLEFLYSGKGNVSRMYDVCRAFYRAEKERKSLMNYFMDFKKTYEELNMLWPFSADIKVQQTQREQIATMSFLAGLSTEFETAKSQILSSGDIPSLHEAFSRILRTESTLPSQDTTSLVVKGGGRERTSYRADVRGRDGDYKGGDLSDVICFYCKEPGHTKRFCKKLQNRNQRMKSANVTMLPGSSSGQPKELESVESGKTCLVTTSDRWVIDSGANEHMTGSSDEAGLW